MTLMSNGARTGTHGSGAPGTRTLGKYINCQRQMETPIDGYFQFQHPHPPLATASLLPTTTRASCVAALRIHRRNWHVTKLMW